MGDIHAGWRSLQVERPQQAGEMGWQDVMLITKSCHGNGVSYALLQAASSCLKRSFAKNGCWWTSWIVPLQQWRPAASWVASNRSICQLFGNFSPFMALTRLHVEYCPQFWTTQYKTQVIILESVQEWPPRWLEGWCTWCMRSGKELSFFSYKMMWKDNITADYFLLLFIRLIWLTG